MRRSAEDRIRDVFARMGRATIREVATECLERGLFDRRWHDEAMVKAAMADVRRALTARDSARLQMAGPTEEVDDRGASIWALRPLWALIDYRKNVRKFVRQAQDTHAQATGLADEQFGRYGESEEVPDLIGRRRRFKVA